MKIECPHCEQSIDAGVDPSTSISCPACSGQIQIKIHAKARPVPIRPDKKQEASSVLSVAATEITLPNTPPGHFVIRSRNDRWIVNFGSKSSKKGSLGFRLTGQVLVADGKLLLDGWRLWPVGGRIALALLIAIMLWFPLKELGWWLTEQFGMLSYTGRGYLKTVQREHNQLMEYFLILPISVMISGVSGWWIGTQWMIAKQTARFTPLSRPTVRSTSATLDVEPEEGGLTQQCTLRFKTLQDAQSFSSRFVE